MNAKKALKFNRENPNLAVGLSKSEAKKLGITSGIDRAKQLINNKFITINDAKAIVRFYDRFKGTKTQRVEQAINLWGGRQFAQELKQMLKSMN
jgi:hypothetical protein